MSSIIFAIINFFKYRKSLKNTDFVIDQVTNLDLEDLKHRNILGLILDFDGVLSFHGSEQPIPEVTVWLKRAVSVFGAKKIFILSNNNLAVRRDFFLQQFKDEIDFIISKPKPSIEGIDIIFNNLRLLGSIEKSQVLLVDDRLATGILAAKIFGIPCCLITNPYVNLKAHMVKELFFMFLRKLERILV